MAFILMNWRTSASSRKSLAKPWRITRAAQDELAYESHRHAAAAYAAGFYKDLVLEFHGLTQDNNLRANTSLEQLAKLKPVFDRSPAGTLTAGSVSLETELFSTRRPIEPVSSTTWSMLTQSVAEPGVVSWNGVRLVTTR